jgi:hypothetical protein
MTGTRWVPGGETRPSDPASGSVRRYVEEQAELCSYAPKLNVVFGPQVIPSAIEAFTAYTVAYLHSPLNLFGRKAFTSEQ